MAGLVRLSRSAWANMRGARKTGKTGKTGMVTEGRP